MKLKSFLTPYWRETQFNQKLSEGGLLYSNFIFLSLDSISIGELTKGFFVDSFASIFGAVGIGSENYIFAAGSIMN